MLGSEVLGARLSAPSVKSQPNGGVVPACPIGQPFVGEDEQRLGS